MGCKLQNASRMKLMDRTNSLLVTVALASATFLTSASLAVSPVRAQNGGTRRAAPGFSCNAGPATQWRRVRSAASVLIFGAWSDQRPAPGLVFTTRRVGGGGADLDPQTLDQWLTRPTALVPGTTMAFQGVASAQARMDLIAYLATLTQSPRKSLRRAVFAALPIRRGRKVPEDDERIDLAAV